MSEMGSFYNFLGISIEFMPMIQYNEIVEISNGGQPTMINITKDTIIGDILDIAPQTAPILLSIGMHCLGCGASRGETVEEACAVHGVDVEKLLKLVNEEANKAQ